MVSVNTIHVTATVRLQVSAKTYGYMVAAFERADQKRRARRAKRRSGKLENILPEATVIRARGRL